jgi:hypothetical protein
MVVQTRMAGGAPQIPLEPQRGIAGFRQPRQLVHAGAQPRGLAKGGQLLAPQHQHAGTRCAFFTLDHLLQAVDGGACARMVAVLHGQVGHLGFEAPTLLEAGLRAGRHHMQALQRRRRRRITVRTEIGQHLIDRLGRLRKRGRPERKLGCGPGGGKQRGQARTDRPEAGAAEPARGQESEKHPSVSTGRPRR